MKRIVTKAIVLSRTNYGEADRIISVLTPDNGKLSLMAKGVRREKSKLAGGIEPFCISSITFVRGRGEVGTLISSRLEEYYANVIKDLERIQLGYDLIKRLNRATEEETGPEYFQLMKQTLAVINEPSVGTELIECWFNAKLLGYGGHTPNLETTEANQKLQSDVLYSFRVESAAFSVSPSGRFSAKHIKLLRLLFSGNQPKSLNKIEDLHELLPPCAELVKQMLQRYIMA